ncbi:hypothetical protein ACXR0O_04455 [Verrucomicrobiota bacterium sgz303538]
MKYRKSKLPILAALALASTLPGSAQDSVDPYKKAAADVAAPEQAGQAIQVSLHLDTFSLPINAAFALLREFPTDGGRYDQLVKLAEQGKAKIERIIVLRTKSGQRALIESIHELRYPTQYKVTDSASGADTKARTPASPQSVYPQGFETRNVGDTFEVEPVISADKTTIDLNLVPQTVLYLGDRDLPNYSGFQQPIFQTQKTSTSARVRVGHPFLLSTPSTPSGASLTKDQSDQRIWFPFITAHLVDDTGEPADRPAETVAPAAR